MKTLIKSILVSSLLVSSSYAGTLNKTYTTSSNSLSDRASQKAIKDFDLINLMSYNEINGTITHYFNSKITNINFNSKSEFYNKWYGIEKINEIDEGQVFTNHEKLIVVINYN